MSLPVTTAAAVRKALGLRNAGCVTRSSNAINRLTTAARAAPLHYIQQPLHYIRGTFSLKLAQKARACLANSERGHSGIRVRRRCKSLLRPSFRVVCLAHHQHASVSLAISAALHAAAGRW